MTLKFIQIPFYFREVTENEKRFKNSFILVVAFINENDDEYVSHRMIHINENLESLIFGKMPYCNVPFANEPEYLKQFLQEL